MTQITVKIPSDVLLNLTPHNIVVYSPDGLILYPKSGTVASLNTSTQALIDTLPDGAPVYEPQEFTSITPETPQLNTRRGSIVSMPVAQWLCDTDDIASVLRAWGEIYCADTGPGGAVRDEHGVIIGTRRLVRYLSYPV